MKTNKFVLPVKFDVEAFEKGAEVFAGDQHYKVEILKIDYRLDSPIIGIIEFAAGTQGHTYRTTDWSLDGTGIWGTLHHTSLEPQIDWDAIHPDYTLLVVYCDGTAYLCGGEFYPDEPWNAEKLCNTPEAFASFYSGLCKSPDFGKSRELWRPGYPKKAGPDGKDEDVGGLEPPVPKGDEGPESPVVD